MKYMIQTFIVDPKKLDFTCDVKAGSELLGISWQEVHKRIAISFSVPLDFDAPKVTRLFNIFETQGEYHGSLQYVGQVIDSMDKLYFVFEVVA